MWRISAVVLIGSMILGTGAGASGSGSPNQPDPNTVAAFWNAERRAQAQPRDLVFDQRGLAYLRRANGALQPYGHDVAAQVRAVRATSAPTPAPQGKPSDTFDTTPPAIDIGSMDPGAGQTIGASYTFKATVTDPSGVKSVTFVITYPGGTQTQSFPASPAGGTVWSVSLSGFTNGAWKWRVVAKDNARRGGNTATSPDVAFTVDTGGGTPPPPPPDGVVPNAEWTDGSAAVQTALGRIYFEMPANKKQNRWAGYVCSGTAVTDSATNAVSVILTAAHCVYDDVNKAFARNVLFIPNQAQTSGSGTDTNCGNDPLGCWAPSYGVVDSDWSGRKWPDNIAWDYAYYVVPTTNAHTPNFITPSPSASLEVAAGTLAISFDPPVPGAATHALGYSYSDDPKLMYCKEGMGTTGSVNYWLSQCGLSGGSSGGSWNQSSTGGTGPVISVNSWGYSGSPGMAGPKLSGTSAECLFGVAASNPTPTDRGVIPGAC